MKEKTLKRFLSKSKFLSFAVAFGIFCLALTSCNKLKPTLDPTEKILECIYIHITLSKSDTETAYEILKKLHSDKIISSGQIMDTESSWHWDEDGINKRNGVLLVVRALRENLETIVSKVEEMHPDKVPQIIALPEYCSRALISGSEYFHVHIVTQCIEEAREILDYLVCNKIISGGQIIQDVQSYSQYVCGIGERNGVLIVTTMLRENFETIASKIKEMCHDGTPQIIALPIIDVSQKFLEYMNKHGRS